jgi:hypothetical protein
VCIPSTALNGTAWTVERGQAVTLDIPIDPEELDAHWMTRALKEAGVARGRTVTALEFEGYVGTGQMSRNGRFRLTWSDHVDRPATVVAKFPSDDPTVRASAFRSGAYRNEYNFYARVAATVSIRTPKCWVARFSGDEERCILVQEDMARSVQGDQFAVCSPEQADMVVAEAVGLHAPRWGDATLETSGLPATEARAEGMAAYYQATVGPCLARLGNGFSDDVVELIERFSPAVARWAEGTGTPTTVVHGDFRPDNFLFGAAPGAPALTVVDWQTAMRGLGAIDVAYFIGGGYPPNERDVVERDLVESYRQRLNAAGMPYSKAHCWDDYRWGSLHGVFISVLAATTAAQTSRGDRMLTLMACRHAQHAIDLEALELVEN